MEVVLWAITGLLAAQLLFVVWNLSGLAPLGGTGEGRRLLDGKALVGASQANEPAHSEMQTHRETQPQPNLQIHPEKQPRPKPQTPPEQPVLSVLIPARDEADNIGPCLRSVLAEHSQRLEVLVLDDQSTDGTGALALEAAEGDARCRIIRGRTLPPGWTGKSHACSQLSAEAAGEWLLFLDADARLEREALAMALDTALAQGRGLVTGFPYQHTSTWLEKLIVPLMNFTIACHLPVRLVRGSRDPKFVAAHGAFLLIHSDTYRKIGGHAAFGGHLVDDMQLARAVKAAGEPVTLADVSGQVTMRMYRDASGVWNGYKKNVFSGVGRSTLLLGMLIASYLAMYVLPPLSLIVWVAQAIGITATGAHDLQAAVWLLPAACGWALGLLIKFAVDRRSRHPLGYALLLAPGILVLAGIAFASWRASISGRGYVWKGRRYT